MNQNKFTLEEHRDISRLMVLISSSSITLLDLIQHDSELVEQMGISVIALKKFTQIIDGRLNGNN